MKNVILISPPAAGKGTLANLINKKYKIPHISTGVLIRTELENNQNGELEKIYTSGSLIPDDLVIDLLNKRISMPDCVNGYIIDGYPRNIKQAKVYNNLNNIIAIYLNIDFNIALDRVKSRLNCSNCGAVYNIKNEQLRPKITNQCDKCNHLLSKRQEDTEEVLKKRFESFEKETQEVIKFYKNHNVLYEMDASVGSDKVFEKLESILNDKHSE